MRDDVPALLRADEALLRPIDLAFAQVRRRWPGALPCARGCSSCCVALFEITSLDVWRLWVAWPGLDPGLRQSLGEGAARVRGQVAALRPGWGWPWDVRDLGARAFGELGLTLDLRCPALGAEGECRIYDARPRICRLQGVSWRDTSTGELLEDHCAQVFGDATYAALPPQPMDLLRGWEEEAALRARVCEGLPPELGVGYRTFVAGAIGVVEGLQNVATERVAADQYQG